ncbi:MAG: hypothetical protein QXQ79_02305, partial [Candidatus Nanoarchaeia archaeon]
MPKIFKTSGTTPGCNPPELTGKTGLIFAQFSSRTSLKSLFSPELLPDYEKGIERIKKAIKGEEKILIWGHEDLDGITATVFYYNILKDLRAKVSFYIPVK